MEQQTELNYFQTTTTANTTVTRQKTTLCQYEFRRLLDAIRQGPDVDRLVLSLLLSMLPVRIVVVEADF